MTVYNLPDDIFSAEILAESIIIHDYAAQIGTFKGKSILHRNAISLVIAGEKTMQFAEKTVVVKDDELHFLSSGNCLASMDLSKQAVFRTILIFFDDAVLSDFYVKYDTLIKALKTVKTAPEGYVFFKKDDFIYNFIASLTLILGNKQQLSMPMKSLKFEELMLYLLERHPSVFLSFQPLKRTHSGDLSLRQVVETNITNTLTVEELAFLCNMSISTFKRQFEKIYGNSPNKWMRQKRMTLAANLLKNQNTRPSDVFHQVGYENHSSFSQSFKQTFGKTPTDYQAEIMNA